MARAARGLAAAPPFLRVYYRTRRDGLSLSGRILWRLFRLGFGLWAAINARVVAERHGRDRAWARTATAYARRRLFSPAEIHWYDLLRETDDQHFMRLLDVPQVIGALNPHYRQPTSRTADKIAFADYCAEAGLPIPRTIATCQGGRLDARDPAFAGDVFVKPAKGRWGQGAQVVSGARLAGVDTATDWIAQERIRPHPALARLALDALSTLRIVTALNEADEAEMVFAALKFPGRRGLIVDNGVAGGLTAQIDGESGVLTSGARTADRTDIGDHPVNGAQVKGLKMPFWRECRALALETHDRLFRDYGLLGWDIAPTADGPLIIEANDCPSIRMIQLGADCGVGAMRLGEIIAWRLNRANGGRP